MKNDDIDPSEAAAAAIKKQEDKMNSSVYGVSDFAGELGECEVKVQELYEDISKGGKGKCPMFDDCGELVDKGMFDDRNVTKATLSGWLVTALEVLNHTKWNMSRGNEVMHRLKNEKINDLETIIGLQKEVITKQNSELSDVVQETLKKEMKSYSDTVKKNFPAPAITPKQIKSVVREAVALEDRSKNVMIFGLEEEEDEDLGEKITGLLEDLGERPQLVDCKRLGKATTKKPVKVTLRSPEAARQVLAQSRKLRHVPRRETVYICPDRTPEERELYTALNNEMKNLESVMKDLNAIAAPPSQPQYNTQTQC